MSDWSGGQRLFQRDCGEDGHFDEVEKAKNDQLDVVVKAKNDRSDGLGD